MQNRISWFFFSLLVGLPVLVTSVPLATSVWAANDEWLFTPEEAAMQMRDGVYADPVAVVEGPGPIIAVKNPKMLQRLYSPVNIYITFEPGKSGKKADMKTLKVTLIGFFDIDITDRLKEYVRGTNLEVEKAKLPSGKHRLRMRIKDVVGNPNERDVVVTVLGK